MRADLALCPSMPSAGVVSQAPLRIRSAPIPPHLFSQNQGIFIADICSHAFDCSIVTLEATINISKHGMMKKQLLKGLEFCICKISLTGDMQGNKFSKESLQLPGMDACRGEGGIFSSIANLLGVIRNINISKRGWVYKIFLLGIRGQIRCHSSKKQINSSSGRGQTY